MSLDLLKHIKPPKFDMVFRISMDIHKAPIISRVTYDKKRDFGHERDLSP